ncbi:hypothetical protein Tco_0424720 [Tanacetum coccineum]
MENVNPPSTLGSFSEEPSAITHAKFTARINKLLQMRQTIDSLLFKTMNDLTKQSSDSDIFCPEERIKELELRTQRRNNFEEELIKNRFPIEKELAYHKELLGEPQPPFSTLEPKIRRGGPWSLKIPYLGSVIDSGLSEVVLGQPFAHTSKLIYDESLGLNRLEKKGLSMSLKRPLLHGSPEQAFVEYASSRTDEAGDAKLSKFEADFKQQQSEMTNKIDTVLKVITDQIAGTLPSDTVKNPKLSTYPVLSARSYPTEDP